MIASNFGTALVVAAALTLSGLASTPASGAPDFYQPPARLPSAIPGTVIKAERFAPPLDAVLGIAHATRVMYVSTDARNRPIPVTGTVFTPTAGWAGGGERPLIALGAGTHGQGPQCVSSRAFSAPLRAHPPADLSFSYEQPSIKALLDRGYVVAVTDYVQAGGVQTYLNRSDQGKSLIDAARAARRLPGAAPTGPVGFWGYSQGGAAAAAAAELQPSYAPELAVRAVYAGAPPADLAQVLARADNGVLAAAAGWVVNTALTADPQLREPVNARINPAGASFLATTRGQCLTGATAFGFQPSHRYTRSGQPLIADLLAIPGFASWLTAQRLGTATPAAPVLVHSARHDDVVPFEVQAGLAGQWRARGAHVDHFVLEAPPVLPGTATNHSLPHQIDNERVLAWFSAKLAR